MRHEGCTATTVARDQTPDKKAHTEHHSVMPMLISVSTNIHNNPLVGPLANHSSCCHVILTMEQKVQYQLQYLSIDMKFHSPADKYMTIVPWGT